MKRWYLYLILFVLTYANNASQAQSDRQLPDSVNALIRRAQSFFPSGRNDSTWSYAQSALTLAQRIGDKPGIAKALITQSIYFSRTGNTTAALDLGLTALKMFEDQGLDSGAADASVTIAQIYKNLGGDKLTGEYLNKGLDYCRQAVRLFTHLKDTNGIISALNETGVIDRDLGVKTGDHRYYDSAFSGYVRALRLHEISGKGTDDLGRLYNNISQVYTEDKKDYPSALRYLQKAIDFNQQHHNFRSLSFNYGYIAHVYDKMGDRQHSLEYALKTLAVAQQLKTPERLANAYFQLTESYKDMGRNDSALFYFTLYHHLSDSLANLDKTRQIADMQAKYESVKKEAEIDKLNRDTTGKNRQILLLAVGLTATFLIAGLLFWLYRRVIGQKEIISRQSVQLETMMKELHHRVKNNLQIVSSLLNLQAYRLNDDEAIAVIRQSQQRVHAMSLIHQRLYKTDESASVNIKDYLTDLAESLLASYGYDRDGFDLRISTQQEFLDVDKVLPLGLIVNEIITNAFKYAYQDTANPSLHIECTEQEEHIILSITDNGKGWDQSKWRQDSSPLAKGGSFGKQLVTALCKQLRATQELTVDNGTRFTFIFPRQVQTA